MDFADQRDIAVRIDHAGVGLALSKPPSTEAIRAAVERVLDEPDFAANAAKLSAVIAQDDGPRAAAQLMLDVAG